ncbi:Uncharacterized protein Adt_32304 [Abeliophyllum distichum]|uniref:Uncharacterized protein n=1 Tax=Abeliophyllum distichum TaxID=126358 RepID=A0ABD1QT48_9LAMI
MEGMVEMSLHISMQIGYKRTARHEFFDVNPRRYSKADCKLVVDGIEVTAARRFRQYKANVNAYIRDKGTAVPYRGLTRADEWEKCIERSSSQKFKLPTPTPPPPPPPPPLSPMHEEELDYLNAEDYLSDL